MKLKSGMKTRRRGMMAFVCSFIALFSVFGVGFSSWIVVNTAQAGNIGVEAAGINGGHKSVKIFTDPTIDNIFAFGEQGFFRNGEYYLDGGVISGSTTYKFEYADKFLVEDADSGTYMPSLRLYLIGTKNLNSYKITATEIKFGSTTASSTATNASGLVYADFKNYALSKTSDLVINYSFTLKCTSHAYFKNFYNAFKNETDGFKVGIEITRFEKA